MARSFTRRRLLLTGVAPVLIACAGLPGSAPARTPEPTRPASAAPFASTPAGAAPAAPADATPPPALAAATAQPTGGTPVAAQPPRTPVSVEATAAARPAAGSSASRLVVMLGQQPDTLMPRIGSALARSEVLGALHTRAVATDELSNPVPIGVEVVPTFDNGGAKWVGDGDDKHLEVTFKIRRGLKWHDGTPVTANDVRFAWTLLMNPKVKVDDRTAEERVNAVDTLDDQTIVFKYHSARQARDAAARGFMGLPPDEFKDWRNLTAPVADPLYYLVLDWGFFLPEHILGKVDPTQLDASDFGRKPILAGPYRFKEWVPDQSIALEAVPDYPLGAPKIGTLLFRVVKDDNAQLAALTAGEVDVMTQVQGVGLDRAPELDRLQAIGYKPYYVPGSAWEHLDFNLDNEHLRDRNVRKAIAHGIDRQAIINKLLFGKTTVAHSWVQPGLPPWAWDENSVIKYPFDQAKAKQLLAEAGYSPGPDGVLVKNGRRLQLRVSTTNAGLRKSVGQMIQQQLKAIGVGIELDFLPRAGFFENGGPLKKRTFEIALYTWLSQLNPDRADYLHSKNVPTDKNTYVGNNFMDYANPRVDELLVKGGGTIDEKERRPVYLELQKIVTDDLPFLPLYQSVSPIVARAKLQNFKPTATSMPETWNAYQWALS